MQLKTLYDKYKGICHFCGHRTNYTWFGRKKYAQASRATREHLHPRIFGGGNGDNLVLACSRCNQLKGDLLISIEAFSQIAKQLPPPIKYLAAKERETFLTLVNQTQPSDTVHEA